MRWLSAGRWPLTCVGLSRTRTIVVEERHEREHSTEDL